MTMLLGIHFEQSSRQASPICSDYISHLSMRKFIFPTIRPVRSGALWPSQDLPIS